MKKILFVVLAISTLSVYSCRQEDEMLSSEDVATLKIIEKSSTARNAGHSSANDTISVGNETSGFQFSAVDQDGDPAPPPKK